MDKRDIWDDDKEEKHSKRREEESKKSRKTDRDERHSKEKKRESEPKKKKDVEKEKKKTKKYPSDDKLTSASILTKKSKEEEKTKKRKSPEGTGDAEIKKKKKVKFQDLEQPRFVDIRLPRQFEKIKTTFKIIIKDGTAKYERKDDDDGALDAIEYCMTEHVLNGPIWSDMKDAKMNNPDRGALLARWVKNTSVQKKSDQEGEKKRKRTFVKFIDVPEKTRNKLLLSIRDEI